MNRPTSIKHCAGVGLVEFIILWPVLVLVILACVQMGLMYRTKATFNQATFMAARDGALNHGFVEPMRNTLARALGPLYLKSDPGPTSYLAALSESQDQNAVPTAAAGGIRIDVISPTTALFDVQDANLLKIKAHMCYKLEVPLVDRMIHQTVALLGGTGAHWPACAARTAAAEGDYYLPLSSSAIVRMQTPVRCEGDVRDGGNCHNLR